MDNYLNSTLRNFVKRLDRSKFRWIVRLVPSPLKRMIMRASIPPLVIATKKNHDPDSYPKGVNLFGYFKAQMGIGQGARLYADALAASEIPHVLINTNIGNPSSHNEVAYDNRLADQAVYNTNITHVNAEQLPLLLSSRPTAEWDRRYHIGVWLWELEDFPVEWNKSFAFLDEIWTPSHFSSRAIGKNTSLPVRTIPYGIQANTSDSFTRSHYGLPQDAFLFLSMFDAYSIMERKNPVGAIEAYKAAFGSSSTDVGLVVKVSNAGKRELSILHRHIGNTPNIYILNRTMGKTEVNSLIACCDAFVSLHRSEGFGLVIAEAMLLGVPAIATNWSANVDFMTSDNSCPVDYKLIDTKKGYYMSRSGQRWADPDIEHAANYMRRLYQNREYRDLISRMARKHMTEFFSAEKSGEAMRERLREIGVL